MCELRARAGAGACPYHRSENGADRAGLKPAATTGYAPDPNRRIEPAPKHVIPHLAVGPADLPLQFHFEVYGVLIETSTGGLVPFAVTVETRKV